MFVCILRKCPHKCPRAHIFDERLFEELNWRPELSFCDKAELASHRRALDGVGRAQHGIGYLATRV